MSQPRDGDSPGRSGGPVSSSDPTYTLKPSDGGADAAPDVPGDGPRPWVGPALNAPRAPLAPANPAHYAIAGELAQGGIGRILRARDLRLDRPVALKQMLAPSREAESRFVGEAFITARLQHPSIVPVYEAGRWPNGEPFYAMKLVSGRPLSELIAERTSLEKRLALLPHVLAVTEAIAYAHSEHIIHRDLKPANVLVGDFGETVVIDWGLAKDLSREEARPGAPSPSSSDPLFIRLSPDASDQGLTQVGTVMGTPAYMPPEQAAGQPVDERADVYALGAILYHLLAGTRPYEGRSSEQVLRRVVEGPPPPVDQRQERIPGDLLAIVSKAMARGPSERYATARALAEDLRRFQTGQIVGAHEYSRAELVRRFLRRYRAAAAVTAVALLLLTLLGAASLHRIIQERDAAQMARAHAEGARRDMALQKDQLALIQARDAVEQASNESIFWLKQLSNPYASWHVMRLIAADARAHGFALLGGHDAPVDNALFLADGHSIASVSDDRTVHLWDFQRGTTRVLEGHTDEAWQVVALPDGQGLISSGKDGTLRRWELGSGLGRLWATLDGPTSALALACQGQCLLAMSRKGEVLYRWDLATGQQRTWPLGVVGATELLVSPVGSRFLVHDSESDKRLLLGDLERESVQTLTQPGPWATGAFAPDGRLFVADSLGQLFVYMPGESQGQRIAQGVGAVSFLLFIPGTQQVAVGTKEGQLRLWDVTTGRSQELPDSMHEAPVFIMDVSADGRYLASGGLDGAVRLWDLSTREPPRVLRGSKQGITCVKFSPDARWLLSGGYDGQVRVFSVANASHDVLSVGPPQTSLVISPDGRRIASLSARGSLRLTEATSGATLLDVPGHAQGTLAFSPEGRWLAAGGLDGRVLLRNASTGEEVGVLRGHASAVVSLAFSADGEYLATADETGAVWLWTPGSRRGHELGRHGARVLQLAFSPKAPLLAAAGEDGVVRLWRVPSGDSQLLRGHEDAVTALAFSPDGQRLVSGSKDHSLLIWNLSSGQPVRVETNGSGVVSLHYAPRGDWVAVRNQRDSRVMLFDTRRAVRVALLGKHRSEVLGLAFSPDGTRLATASADRTVRLWELPGEESRVLRGHTGAVTAVAFAPDGRSLVSTGQDGSLRRWSDDLPEDEPALRAWMETVPVHPPATSETAP